MKLAIIAAGEGSRLKDEGIGIPKPMIEINGEKLIDRLIRIGMHNECEGVCCIVNEESTDVAKYLLRQKSVVPIDVKIKSTPSSLHSLKELGKFIKQPFVLTTVDAVFDEVEFNQFINHVHKTKADAVLGITNYIDDEKPLCVEIDKAGRVLSFHNRKENHQWATGGIYFFRRNIFNDVNKVIESGVHRLRNFLNYMLMNGYKIDSYRFSKIIDVDHADDIQKAEELVRNMESAN